MGRFKEFFTEAPGVGGSVSGTPPATPSRALRFSEVEDWLNSSYFSNAILKQWYNTIHSLAPDPTKVRDNRIFFNIMSQLENPRSRTNKFTPTGWTMFPRSLRKNITNLKILLSKKIQGGREPSKFSEPGSMEDTINNADIKTLNIWNNILTKYLTKLKSAPTTSPTLGQQIKGDLGITKGAENLKKSIFGDTPLDKKTILPIVIQAFKELKAQNFPVDATQHDLMSMNEHELIHELKRLHDIVTSVLVTKKKGAWSNIKGAAGKAGSTAGKVGWWGAKQAAKGVKNVAKSVGRSEVGQATKNVFRELIPGAKLFGEEVERNLLTEMTNITTSDISRVLSKGEISRIISNTDKSSLKTVWDRFLSGVKSNDEAKIKEALAKLIIGYGVVTVFYSKSEKDRKNFIKDFLTGIHTDEKEKK